MTIEHFKKTELPDTPGVYFFLNKQKNPKAHGARADRILYIGKATSLRDRVRSYFSNDLIKTRGQLLVNMVDEATHIDFKTTDSVLEALLVEADLIKKFCPAFNTKEKDDKSFLCIGLTDEEFPAVITVRKKDVVEAEFKAVYGPYTNGLQLKEALKIVRKIFPYRDTKCNPKGSVKNKLGKPCFNRQIGLCPGVCTGEISVKEYKKVIKHLETFFSGNVKKLTNDLEKEMNSCAKEREFEKASYIKNKIYALTHIQDISLIKNDSTNHHDPNSFRIESYDIAHMAGQNMVGVMTVVVDGHIEKSQYRKFKINTVSASNDTKALSEVVKRRIPHTEWPMPSLIVVDGGVAQLNAINKVVEAAGLTIPVVSVVKDAHHQPKDVLGSEAFGMKYRKEILLSNAEAHRFAIGYHKKMRRKNFLPEN